MLNNHSPLRRQLVRWVSLLILATLVATSPINAVRAAPLMQEPSNSAVFLPLINNAPPQNQPPPNQPPTVDAGIDQSVTLPNHAFLTGSVSDDGQPNPPGQTTVTWSKSSGSGEVTFATPNASSTEVTFSQSGSYSLRLTVSDGALSVFDELLITVNPAADTPANWAGTTSQSYPMSFTVSADGNQWSQFSLTTNFSVPACGVSGTTTLLLFGPGDINDNKFSEQISGYSFSGEFTSASQATGNYVFDNYKMTFFFPFPPFTCTGYFSQSGTWSAAR